MMYSEKIKILLAVITLIIFTGCTSENKKEQVKNTPVVVEKNETEIKTEVKTGNKKNMSRIDFETEDLGKWEEFFNGSGDKTSWGIVENNGNKVLFQNSNNTFNTIIYNDFVAKDLELSVDIKRVSGKNDQGGGIIWRWIDANNYYVARANPLEDNVVLYKMEDGARKSLDIVGGPLIGGYGVDVPTLGDNWNNLKVQAEGNVLSVFLNSKEIFKVEDDTFQNAGKVGLWSKSDARTYFDNFIFSHKGKEGKTEGNINAVVKAKEKTSVVVNKKNTFFTIEDVALHNKKGDCYTAIEGKVYDVSSFFGKHPGGDDNLMKTCGIDATIIFQGKHGKNAKAQMKKEEFYIGELQ